ncbi:MAG: peptidylprolyl isomerase [Acidobacteriia bacterium]|nr:peptidylprolyl isomerase [Terriglobia bacterium]
MKRSFALIAAILVLSLFTKTFAQAPTVANARTLDTSEALALKTPDKSQVVIETNLGTMTMQLYGKAAPKMVAHFKKLVGEGFYNGLKFHRVIPGFMIQGGDYMSKFPDKSKWGMGRPNEEKIPAEFHADLHHIPGTVAAARTSDPNSASTQFYICVGTPSHLDGQYTIFGQLVDGASLAVAKKISEVQRDPSDHPLTDVVMKRVYLKGPKSAIPTHTTKSGASSKSKTSSATKK